MMNQGGCTIQIIKSMLDQRFARGGVINDEPGGLYYSNYKVHVRPKICKNQ